LARIGAKLESLGRSIVARKPGQTSVQNFVSM
jgi:hypothetical protein